MSRDRPRHAHGSSRLVVLLYSLLNDFFVLLYVLYIPSHEYFFLIDSIFYLCRSGWFRIRMEIDFIAHCYVVIFIKQTSSSSSSDESGADLNTCMDYSTWTSANRYPNQHDVELLDTLYDVCPNRTPSSAPVGPSMSPSARPTPVPTLHMPTKRPSIAPTYFPTRSPSTLNNIGTSTEISHRDYQNNEDVNWFYQPSSGTLNYLVHFESSEIENYFDYLLFGPSGTNTRRNRCTGTAGTCPDVYISSSTGIRFDFHSDYSITKSGFTLSVRVVGDTPPATSSPSSQPSLQPSNQPTSQPTAQPTSKPTHHSHSTTAPILSPTTVPSAHPTIDFPFGLPTIAPTTRPTIDVPFGTPTSTPTTRPTSSPSMTPTTLPTVTPTTIPTTTPTLSPTAVPSATPTIITLLPSMSPTASPTNLPTPHLPVVTHKNIQSSIVSELLMEI
jgi:hypothetical protein